MYTIKKQYRLIKTDLEFLNGLGSNLPDTKLTKKEIDGVSRIYHTYVGKTLDNIDWSPRLMDMELKERWPSGPRLKRHEAQRIVLGFLINAPLKMSNKEAAKVFFYSLTSRDAARKMYAHLYIKNY